MCVKECSWLTNRASEGPHYSVHMVCKIESLVCTHNHSNVAIVLLMLTALESGRQPLGVRFVGVVGNMSVDPELL